MSTARFNTLTDASGGNSMPVADINQGRAKAWWNFNSTGTVATRDSFNVASLTDAGVGAVQVNFTAPMANANFRGSQNAASTNSGTATGFGTQFNQTVSLFYQAQYFVSSTGGAGTASDYPIVVGDVFGDQ